MNTVTEVEATRSNYFFRHWRGDLSLPVSYWINGVLINIGLGIIIFGVTYATGKTLSGTPFGAPTFAAYIIFVWCFSIAFMVWISVGIWRSATKYFSARSESPRFKAYWGTLAKISVVIGVIGMSYELFIGEAGISAIVRLLNM